MNPADSTTSPDDTTARNKTTAGIIFLTLFVDLVGFSIIFPLFPSLLDHYFALEGEQSLLGQLLETLRSWTPEGTPESQNALVQTLFGGCLGALYSLLQFLFSPLWGRLSDRYGRRPILLTTLAGTALSYVLWFVSGSFVLFIVSRIIAGIASGNISTATAAMADITDRKDRAKGMGPIGAAFGLGFIMGPAIGGGLSTVDLSTSFPALADLGVNPFSAAAGGALVLSAFNLVWAFRKFRETLPKERRSTESPARTIDPRSLFTRRYGPDVFRTQMANFVFLIAFSGMEFTLTFLVRDRLGWSEILIAGMFVYVGFLIALVQGGVVRRVAPKYGEKRVAVIGLLSIVPGLVLVAIASSGALLYLGLGAMAIGSALATPTLTALVSLHAPEDRQGEVIGVFRSLGALARAIGPLVAAAIYWRWGSGSPYLVGAAILIVPVLLTLGVQQPDARQPDVRQPDDAEEEAAGTSG